MIFSFCAGWMYRDAVWPWPPSQTSFSALSSASSKSFAWYIASTGESFSCANSSESSTLSTSPMRIFVSSGTSTPASCRDGVRALADDLRIQRAVDQNRVAHLIQLVPLEEVAAAARKLRAHLVVDAVQHRHALLGGADHAVVKRLGMDDRADGQLDIRASRR